MTTQAQVKAAIRQIGFIVTYEDGEYRVALPVRCYGGDTERQEAQAYYTDDGADALGTAQAWRKQLDAK